MQSGGTINVSSILSGKRVAKLELGVGVRVRGRAKATARVRAS